jgi:hypothetical protein
MNCTTGKAHVPPYKEFHVSTVFTDIGSIQDLQQYHTDDLGEHFVTISSSLLTCVVKLSKVLGSDTRQMCEDLILCNGIETTVAAMKRFRLDRELVYTAITLLANSILLHNAVWRLIAFPMQWSSYTVAAMKQYHSDYELV